MKETFLVIREPNFQAINDMFSIPAVVEKFSPNQIQEIQRQIEATVFHSNITYLADIFEDIASEYLSQRNRLLFTSFPAEGNEVTFADEGPRIKSACHYLKAKADTIEALMKSQDVGSFQEIIYKWLNLGPRQKGTVEKAILNITKYVSSLNELVDLVPEMREKIGQLSKRIHDGLRKLKDGDLIRMAAYFLRDSKPALLQEMSCLNEHDINDIANAILTLFWYPKVREDLLIKPDNTIEMEKLRMKYGIGVTPRTNDFTTLYEVVANHLELVFLCFPELVEHRQAIIDRFVDLVGKDAPKQNGISISWEMNPNELEIFHKNVNNLMASKLVIQSEREAVAPSPQNTPGKLLVQDKRYGDTGTAALNDSNLSDDTGSSYTDSGKGSQRTSTGSSKPVSGEASGDEEDGEGDNELIARNVNFPESSEQVIELDRKLRILQIEQSDSATAPIKEMK